MHATSVRAGFARGWHVVLVQTDRRFACETRFGVLWESSKPAVRRVVAWFPYCNWCHCLSDSGIHGGQPIKPYVVVTASVCILHIGSTITIGIIRQLANLFAVNHCKHAFLPAPFVRRKCLFVPPRLPLRTIKRRDCAKHDGWHNIEKIKPDSKVVEKEPSAGVSQEKAPEITIPVKKEPSMKDIYKMMKKF